MSDSDKITEEELERAAGEQLPDREAMSVIDVGGPLGGPFVEPIGGPALPVEPAPDD